jgi:hypothetical protein
MFPRGNLLAFRIFGIHPIFKFKMVLVHIAIELHSYGLSLVSLTGVVRLITNGTLGKTENVPNILKVVSQLVQSHNKKPKYIKDSTASEYESESDQIITYLNQKASVDYILVLPFIARAFQLFRGRRRPCSSRWSAYSRYRSYCRRRRRS